MNHTKRPQREIWGDFVRATAAFLVVWLHSAAPWLDKYGKEANEYWQFANIADSSVRMSVPLFFMISGYLLLGRPVFLGAYFRKRVARVAVPLIVWSALYVFWNMHNGFSTSLLNGIRFFVNGNITVHLWFLYSLAGLYLFIPVLSWLVDINNPSKALYFTAIWFAAASIMRIPLIPDTDSGARRTAVPVDPGHPIGVGRRWRC